MKHLFTFIFIFSVLSMPGQIGVITIKKPAKGNDFKKVKIYCSKEKSDSTLTDVYVIIQNGLVVQHVSYQMINGKLDTVGVVDFTYDTLKRVKSEIGWSQAEEHKKWTRCEWEYPDSKTTILTINDDGKVHNSMINAVTRSNKEIRKIYEEGKLNVVQRIKTTKYKKVVRQKDRRMMQTNKIIDHFDHRNNRIRTDVYRYSGLSKTKEMTWLSTYDENNNIVTLCEIRYRNIQNIAPCRYYEYVP